LISDGTLIGKPDFTHKLIRFIMLADVSVPMGENDVNKWETNDFYKSNGDSAGDGNINETLMDSSDKDRDNNPEAGNSSQDQKGTDNGNNNNNKNGKSASDRDPKDESNNKKRQRTGNSGNGQNTLMTSKTRPSNICQVVSADISSSTFPIKTAKSPTQIMQSADDQYFTGKTISPGPEVPEMDNPSGNIKSKSIDRRSHSKRMTNEEQMMWQRAFTGLGNADKKYLDEDQNGVIIPYLCQLEGVEVECLGTGRCGTVKKIRWNGGFAAMKEYVLKHEDERTPCDVYEHELKVFYRLQALWGKYVPRLMFHSPWSSCPSIGMEVGQPMDYDIEKWTEEDRQQMNHTIAKLKGEGFEQNDMRGTNFVRLDNGHIAMIDFEDVVENSSS
jgi:hypothetical protein